MQNATARNFNARTFVQRRNTHGNVAFLFAHQTLVELARAHNLAFATNQGAGRRLEHNGHRGFFHGNWRKLNGVFTVGDDVANVSIFNADNGNNVARLCLKNIRFAQVLKNVNLANGCVVAARAIVFYNQDLLFFMQDAAMQTANANATFVAAVINGADLQRHRTLKVNIGARDLFQNGIQQRNHIHVAIVVIVARITVHGGCVNHREVQLFIGSTQLHHELKHLVDSGIGISVGAVDLVHHHHNAQVVRKRMAQHETRLRLGAFVSVNNQQSTIGHVQNALNFATEVGVTRRVDDVDLYALVINGNVLRKNGDAALTFLIVAVQHAVFHLLICAEYVGGLQQLVNQRSFAVVNVRDNSHVTNIFLFHSMLHINV